MTMKWKGTVQISKRSQFLLDEMDFVIQAVFNEWDQYFFFGLIELKQYLNIISLLISFKAGFTL
jgi:hypothetical protein